MKWTEWILRGIYPPRCPICDAIVAADEGMVCRKCRKKLSVIEGYHCAKCGKFVDREEREYCSDCEIRDHWFDEGFGVFPYHGWVQESMIRFKFHGRQEYGTFFGNMMARRAEKKVSRWKPQVILPVPMHKKKMRMRGYNQAELMAKAVGAYLELEVRTDLIFRVEDTKPQKDLSPGMRRKNLQKAFKASEDAGEYQKILLVDDIYTTGSTADAAAKALKAQGVRNVYLLTACTGTQS